LIFEVASGDIAQYEIIGQQPGDLFFKWVKWRRREKRSRLEFEAGLHGMKLGGCRPEIQSSHSAAPEQESLAEIAHGFSGRLDFTKGKVSKAEKARRLKEIEERKSLKR